MKKILLSAALLVAAVSFANAQWYIGGSVGFETSKSEFYFDENGDLDTYGGDAMKSTSYTILPKVGYILNDQWQVGLSIGYQGSTSELDVNDATKTTTGSFVVNPYVRYTAWEVGRFALGFQADVDAAFGNVKVKVPNVGTTKNKMTAFGINIAPVVTFDLTPCVQLESKFNFASLGYNSTQLKDDDDNKIKNSGFDLGWDSDNAFTTGDITVGFIVKF